MHILFLSLLTLCVLAFLCTRRPHGKSPIGIFFGLLFLALLMHQAWWQIHGAGSAAFLHFRTHYDRREHPHQGQLLDTKGIALHLSPATFHLLGYDKKGATTGLRRVYRLRLSGSHAPQKEMNDLLSRTPPQDIALTLDLDLQTAAYNALQGRPGAIIALNPQNGDILALVSSPSLSLEDLEKNTARHNTPHFNRATQGLYPPGSVFKLFTAALAIEHNKASPRLCPAQGWSPSRGTPPIRDTHPHPGNEKLPITTAFAESSNIWFAKAAVDCGWDAFNAAFLRAGLNQSYTLAQDQDLSFSTAKGTLPSLKNKKAASLAHPAFGQGALLLTPLHIALLTASIANEGLLYPPRLEKEAPICPPTRIWEKSTAQNVKALMARSVKHGTSQAIAHPRLAICGKTGTAETDNGPSHSWFTCFAPQENPKIVLTVLVEHGGYGAASALPIAQSLLEHLLLRGWLKP